MDPLGHEFSQITISMCLRVPCYNSGSEAVSLWGGLRILMMGRNLSGKGSVEMHSTSFILFFQFVERLNPNPLAVAL